MKMEKLASLIGCRSRPWARGLHRSRLGDLRSLHPHFAFSSSIPSVIGPPSSAIRSTALRRDDLTAGLRRERPPRRLADAALDEPNRAVEQAHVHAAGVVGAGRDHRGGRMAGSVAEEARLAVG